MAVKLFGGDFEFHFSDENGNGIMAEPILGIDKNAYLSSDVGAAEIRPYASDSKQEFMKTIREMLKELYDKSKERLVISPTVFIGNNKANDFGDDFDYHNKTVDEFNAWYQGKIERTFIDNHIRTQGAHFWLSKSPAYSRQEFVKLLDLFLALPMVYVFRLPGELIRRNKYGMAGSYRENEGLIEYRALSSSIMRHPIILTEMLDMIDAINQNSGKFKTLFELTEKKFNIAKIINSCDSNEAERCIKFMVTAGKKLACLDIRVQIDRYLGMIEYIRNLRSLSYASSLMIKEIKGAWLI